MPNVISKINEYCFSWCRHVSWASMAFKWLQHLLMCIYTILTNSAVTIEDSDIIFIEFDDQYD